MLDKWFEVEVKPRLEGRGFLIRYADDFVVVLSSENDARRVMDVLPKRFGRYGLTLHPEKTRLVPFQRPSSGKPGGEESSPQSFELLGFTHHWAKSLRDRWIVRRKTAPSRFGRALHRISDWCRNNRHLPLAVQQNRLSQNLRGHYGYFGITGNAPALGRFFYQTTRVWRSWLDRRSQRAKMAWPRFLKLLERYSLPQPVVVHSVYRDAAKP